MFDDEDGRVRLEFLDRTIDLPSDAAEAAGVIVGGEPFSPADLPDLDASDQLTLAGRMLREGVVVAA
ncbi:hypothetical protein BH10ACT11_BH10ACT11_07170 [soil metagenome]